MGCESKNSGFRIFPGFTREARLATGFPEKLFAREVVFDSNLGKQESALRVIDNQESVTPDFNSVRTDRLQRRENGNLDVEFFELARYQWTKTRILKGCADRAADYGLSQHLAGLRYANASLQASAHMEGDKDTATFREDSLSWNKVEKFAVRDCLGDRFAG